MRNLRLMAVLLTLPALGGCVVYPAHGHVYVDGYYHHHYDHGHHGRTVEIRPPIPPNFPGHDHGLPVPPRPWRP